MLNTVKVPKQFEPLFEKAQQNLAKYFNKADFEPSKGTISISGERYILVRAASMSIDFFRTISELYKDKGREEAANIARQLLFDIAHAIGKQDALEMSKKLDLKEPVEKLSAGPVHFAYAGWAFVDIFPESKPSPDENYYLIYDHPYSFESDAWLRAGKKSDFPVCVMNAGYSSGWCSESFGLNLVASEILCKAKGDDFCRFIMAPPSKIKEHIEAYAKKEQRLAEKIVNYEIPDFFQRKKTEDELRLFREVVGNMSEGVCLARVDDGAVVYANPKFEEMFGYEPDEILDKKFSELSAPTDETPETATAKIFKAIIGSGEWHGEIKNIRKDNTIFWCYANASLLYNSEYGRVLIFVLDDITDRKKAAEAVEKMNELMVGRELLMREMKKKLNELEKKINGQA